MFDAKKKMLQKVYIMQLRFASYFTLKFVLQKYLFVYNETKVLQKYLFRNFETYELSKYCL